MSDAAVVVAATGDLHLGLDSRGCYRPCLARLAAADLFLVAGDLTRAGTAAEAAVVADELRDLGIPTVVVLGNHDVPGGEATTMVDLLVDSGVTVLDGSSVIVETDAGPVGVAGVKGFGNGFPGAAASNFGEPVMKLFVEEAEREAERLAMALSDLPHNLAARITLTHVSPCEATLRGEPPGIFPFLGSYLLGEVIDAHDVDLAVHGHAHHGAERGATLGGVPVRNVAWPVTGRPYATYAVGVRTSGAR